MQETFDATEQTLVADYLEGGGALFVSGAEIGWDLAELGEPADLAFFSDVLHAQYLGDDAEAYLVRGEGPLAELGRWAFYTPGTQDIRFADQLAPGPGAQQAARYDRGLSGGAAVFHPGPGAVLLLGFPFETIDSAPDRIALMERALELLR